MPRDFLPIFSGFLVQGQRQHSHFVEAWHLFFLPTCVAVGHLPPAGCMWISELRWKAGNVRTQTVSHHGWIKMKLILVVLVVGLLAWKLSPELQSWAEARLSNPQITATVVAAPKPVSAPVKCDGRKYCSQMTSCAEAKNFLQNCPGMKMDGDNDGIPCEAQWCQ
ncbi:Excalibur calcium-binding domain protein [compost metagenome]